MTPLLTHTYLCLTLLIVFSCKGKLNQGNLEKRINTKYAKGFDYQILPDGFLLKIYQIQKKKPILLRLERVSAKAGLPSQVDSLKQRIPFTQIAVSATTHVAQLEKLGQVDKVFAFSEPKLISNQHLKEKNRKGRLIRFGPSHNPDIEALIKNDIQLLITDPFTKQSQPFYDILKRAGVLVIPVEDYLETSPLARFEWILFFGIIVDQLEKAKEIFAKSESRYLELVREITEKIHPEQKASVLLGSPYKDIWYVPTQASFMAHLVRDAGGKYPFDHLIGRHPKEMDLEYVYHHAKASTHWFIQENEIHTLSGFKSKDPFYQNFNAFKQNQVYNWNARMDGAGNAFWESGTTEPEIILSDMITALYPELLPQKKMKYLKALK